MKFKNLALFAAFTLILTALFSFRSSTVITEEVLEKKEWKNLKVLPNDITEDELKGVMRHYNKALGVKCSYCHAEVKGTDKLDFASDEKKEKEYARGMIKMTQEINANYFNWENVENTKDIKVVDCTMSHRGHKEATEGVKVFNLPK